jgi:hypothetical protein
MVGLYKDQPARVPYGQNPHLVGELHIIYNCTKWVRREVWYAKQMVHIVTDLLWSTGSQPH